jgi:hypothetical protein
MRGHGDPDQVDPTVDANNVIHATYPTGYNPKSQVGSSTTNSCDVYLTAASYALGGEPLVQNPSKMLAFSVCMRASGIPDFPDPTNTGGTYHFPIGVHFKQQGHPCGRAWHSKRSRSDQPDISEWRKTVRPEGPRPTMGVHPRLRTGRHRGHCQ